MDCSYLSGNFAPISTSLPLTPCSYEGVIPPELAGGEYVRNGGNPLVNNDLGRDAHWFDGDGMLTGVLFRRADDDENRIIPEFVNRFLLTDVYCYAKHDSFLRKPILPSIATLISPARSWFWVMLAVFRSVFIVLLSRLPGRPVIRKISVANTNVLYHDGRALATCESGPPLRFALPGLETIGWFNGRQVDNERERDDRPGFGGNGLTAHMKEWTTAHPRVDPKTRELIAFHSTFTRPYVRYSIVKPSKQMDPGSSSLGEPVPGIKSPKMMHDFGVSAHHTVIMDLPLTLDPMNHMRGVPSLCYDPTSPSRFGVFPRYEPRLVRWFETNPCLIFHTANCWDSVSSPSPKSGLADEVVVNLLACRLTSAATIFAPGNLPIPEFKPTPPEYIEEEQCRLYYYSFPLLKDGGRPYIRHQWALSAIPFEFPTVAPGKSMVECRYAYGCSTTGTFTVALGKAAKIDILAKIDARALIAKGVSNPPRPIRGCVDTRTVDQVLKSEDPDDPIKLLRMPPGWYAQEPRFVPRSDPRSGEEDDGWLVFYAFDESQLDARGECPLDAKSELWVVDARTMSVDDVVARVKLPQRVPYGLHGNWFSEEEIRNQRPFDAVRSLSVDGGSEGGILEALRQRLEQWIG